MVFNITENGILTGIIHPRKEAFWRVRFKYKSDRLGRVCINLIRILWYKCDDVLIYS